MIRPSYVVMAIFFYLAVTTAPQAQASESVRVERTKDHHLVVLLTVPLRDEATFDGDLHATFDFGKTKGFLGSSSNPEQDSFVNAEGTIIAINHIPATKSSFVHMWLRLSDGDLLFLNNVNERVARLLRGRFAERAQSFLRVEAIAGRKISLQTVDFSKKFPYEDYNFAITVNGKGQLSLAK
jgi:hypothetical protein